MMLPQSSRAPMALPSSIPNSTRWSGALASALTAPLSDDQLAALSDGPVATGESRSVRAEVLDRARSDLVLQRLIMQGWRKANQEIVAATGNEFSAFSDTTVACGALLE